MIWLGPTTVRETTRHDENNACKNHCHSCEVDHHGPAYKWCLECGHAYRSFGELRDSYLSEAPYGPASWRWWRIRFGPQQKVDKLIAFCPLCLHDF